MSYRKVELISSGNGYPKENNDIKYNNEIQTGGHDENIVNENMLKILENIVEKILSKKVYKRTKVPVKKYNNKVKKQLVISNKKKRNEIKWLK